MAGTGRPTRRRGARTQVGAGPGRRSRHAIARPRAGDPHDGAGPGGLGGGHPVRAVQHVGGVVLGSHAEPGRRAADQPGKVALRCVPHGCGEGRSGPGPAQAGLVDDLAERAAGAGHVQPVGGSRQPGQLHLRRAQRDVRRGRGVYRGLPGRAGGRCASGESQGCGEDRGGDPGLRARHAGDGTTTPPSERVPRLGGTARDSHRPARPITLWDGT
jgi:hypothetical protein